jgi:hypothetical protein
MKATITTFRTALTLAVVSAGAWAQTQTASNAVPASLAAEAPTTPSPTPEQQLRSELEQLKQLVRDQQKRIDALEYSHQPLAETPGIIASSAPVKAAPAPTSQQGNATSQDDSSQPQVTPRAQDVHAGSSDERIRNLEREIKGLGPISFSGDVRVRAEPFFGGPADQSLDRARARIRARFNAVADLGSQFRAGITLASGDLNDPISTNANVTGFYVRKPIALDQAFVEFSPTGFRPLTLTAGKFRYPWFNTELTWDKDLNPEGAAESLGFKINTPVLKRIAFIGFQLPFAEIAGTSSTNKRIAQQITYGGQFQTTWALGPRVTLNAYSGFYGFRGSDSIALGLARANSKNPQTPLSGLLPINASSPIQNSMYVTTASTIITVSGTAYPTGVSSVTNAQFGSKFALFDNLAKIDINTGHERLPISFIGDYVQNTEACANLANIVAAPANTATQTFKQTLNATCNSSQRRAYWAEGRVGRLQKKNDFQFGYTRIYIEREAVLGAFNYSEIRQSTNVTQHRVDAFYQFDKSVQLGFTALVGRPLASSEPWLERLQFDTVYVF